MSAERTLAGGETAPERRRVADRLRALVDACEDAIIGVTLAGVVTEWSAGAERMFGYSAAEALGHSAEFLFPPENEREMRSLLERVAGGERVSQLDTGRLHKDGRLIDISTTVSPVRSAAGDVIGAAIIGRDISRRKAAERARERALEDLRQAQRLARIGSWSRSPGTGEASWSEQMYVLYGRDPSRGPASVQEMIDYAHPDDRAMVAAQLRDIQRAGGPAQRVASEYRLVGDDGVTRVVRVIGEPDPERAGWFLGTAQDVSAERAQEAARAEAEARYRLIAEAVSDGVFDTDHRTGERWVSPRLLAALGYDSELPIELHAAQALVHPDDLQAVRGALSERAQRIAYTARIRHRDGHYVPMAVRAAHQYDDSGELVRTLGTVADVTEQLRARAERLALARELHDSVTQDLASARIYLQNAASAPPAQLPEMLTSLRAYLESASDSMRLIIGSLRSDHTSAQEPISISATAQAAIAQARERHPELSFEREDTLSGEPALGTAASAAFGYVLREALQNIVRHARAQTVTVALSEHDGAVVLAVSDDGAGFDPARTPDGHYGLLGMRERVEAVGGRLTLHSAPGHGTRLRAHFPLAPR